MREDAVSSIEAVAGVVTAHWVILAVAMIATVLARQVRWIAQSRSSHVLLFVAYVIIALVTSRLRGDELIIACRDATAALVKVLPVVCWALLAVYAWGAAEWVGVGAVAAGAWAVVRSAGGPVSRD